MHLTRAVNILTLILLVVVAEGLSGDEFNFLDDLNFYERESGREKRAATLPSFLFPLPAALTTTPKPTPLLQTSPSIEETTTLTTATSLITESETITTSAATLPPIKEVITSTTIEAITPPTEDKIISTIGTSSEPVEVVCPSSFHKSELNGAGFCSPCNCGEGASSESCDQDGECSCEEAGIDDPSILDKKCHPGISLVKPTYGPIAGGTNITIHGNFLDKYIADVLVDGEQCRDVQIYKTRAVCRTPSANQTGTVNMEIRLQDNSTSVKTFTYKPNPEVTSVKRVDTFVKGGLPIPFEGENLDSIAEPKITVAMICNSTGETIASFVEECSIETSKEMVCKSPDFSKAIAENSGKCAPASLVSRRKRAAVMDQYQLYDFLMGLQLDGVKKFEDLSKVEKLKEAAFLHLAPDPVILRFTDAHEIRRLKSSEQLLEIKGYNLKSGSSDKDNYKVKVGRGSCIVTSLVNNQLTCRLPEKLPEVDMNLHKIDPETDEAIPAVLVQVGNIEQLIGYIAFPPDRTLTIIIGTCTAAAVILIIVAGILIRIRLRLRTHSINKIKISKIRYVIAPDVGPATVQNPFSVDMDKLSGWVMPLENLYLVKGIGQGQFGKVFEGSLKLKSGIRRKVAVKTIKAEVLTANSHAVSNFMEEALIMKDFDHPNVLSLIGVVVSENGLPMFVIPYMERGDLKHLLKSNSTKLDTGDMLHLSVQAANGMDYLSKKKFIHRDLAARNCMIDEQYYLKIADFGLSHNLDSQDYYKMTDKKKPLPVKWMAVESLNTGKFTTESDVWSYGVLLWEIFSGGATPYFDVPNYDLRRHLKLETNRLCQPGQAPDGVYDLMMQCWRRNPSERPKFSDLSESLNKLLHDDTYTRNCTKGIEEDYLLPSDATDDISPEYLIPDSEARRNSSIEYLYPDNTDCPSAKVKIVTEDYGDKRLNRKKCSQEALDEQLYDEATTLPLTESHKNSTEVRADMEEVYDEATATMSAENKKRVSIYTYSELDDITDYPWGKQSCTDVVKQFTMPAERLYGSMARKSPVPTPRKTVQNDYVIPNEHTIYQGDAALTLNEPVY